MTVRENPEGPFVVWENYGYEGWRPKSYDSLKEALTAQRYNSEFVITKAVSFDVVEANLNGEIAL